MKRIDKGAGRYAVSERVPEMEGGVLEASDVAWSADGGSAAALRAGERRGHADSQAAFLPHKRALGSLSTYRYFVALMRL